MTDQRSYDVVIVGGGHNGLVAAAYLARAGRSVLVLERLDHTGGAAVSARVFAGADARLSRYSYLVSLLPQKILRDLGLRLRLRKRTVASYTPVERGGRPTGLLVESGGTARTRESFAALTGSEREYASWQRFYGMTQHVAERVFPTLTEPLPSRAALRARVGDEAAWRALFERPLGAAIEGHFADDLVRGVVLTDALIGTFTHAHDPSLRQNRCFLYHVIGGGTGDWNVPVGGMGAVTGALADAARAAGAEILTGHEVTAVATDGRTAEVTYRTADTDGAVGARHVLVNASPQALPALLGESPAEGPAGPTPGPAAGEPPGRKPPVRKPPVRRPPVREVPAGAVSRVPEAPEGAQLKVNMLLRRLPELRDPAVGPREAFAGTFHVAEGYEQLETAYRQAAAGQLPDAPPSEIYCHSLTDPSILGPDLARQGRQTLTLFGLHAPARLFTGNRQRNRQDGHADAANSPEGGETQGDGVVRDRLLDAVLAQVDAHLAEPLTDCLAYDADGRPCIEAKTPLDLEAELRLPGGHIFHRDLAFPYGDETTGRWGVETAHPNVLLCGSGAVRGGGVSGIPGHNAAMAVLGK